MATIIDGKQMAAGMRAEIKDKVAELKRTRGITPGLAVILVGDNPASKSYVTAKEKACAEAGMSSKEIRLPATAQEAELTGWIERLNADPHVGDSFTDSDGRLELVVVVSEMDDMRVTKLTVLVNRVKEEDAEEE